MATTIPTTAAASASEASLSNWAAPYATDFLSKGQALASQPYQAYTGPLTAGVSGLQQQAFQGLANLAVPSSVTGAGSNLGNLAGQAQGMAFNPTQFATQDWNAGLAGQYMNPYLQASLNPQLDEARRQSTISTNAANAKLAQAGAYGGSRQAVMNAEGIRNLADTQNQMISGGYNTAYQQALNQFNADQNRQLDAQRQSDTSRQFGATYGLNALKTAGGLYQDQSQLGIAGLNANQALVNAQLAAGREQRNIQQEGITADMNQFKEERAYPYEMLQYQKDLLSGLPINTTRQYTATGTDPIAAMLTGASGAGNLFTSLFNSGTPPK